VTTLSGTFVIPGTDPRPGSGVASRWKLPHVITQLGEDLFDAALCEARNRIQVFERGRHRLGDFRDPTIEVANLLFPELEVGKQVLEGECMVVAEAPDQDLGERGAFLA
jgi:hypothetical protein